MGVIKIRIINIIKRKINTFKDFKYVFKSPLLAIAYYLLKLETSFTFKLNLGGEVFVNYYKDVWMIRELFCDEYNINNFKYKKILDLGGYKGFSIKYFSLKHNNPFIVVFEPNKNSFKSLLKNSVSNKNIIAFNKGVYDKDRLAYLSDLRGSSKICFNGTLKVELIGIRKILEEYGSFDLLKIDIEGSEETIFKSMNKKDFLKINSIIGESHFYNYSKYSNKLKKYYDYVDFEIKADGKGLFKAWRK